VVEEAGVPGENHQPKKFGVHILMIKKHVHIYAFVLLTSHSQYYHPALVCHLIYKHFIMFRCSWFQATELTIQCYSMIIFDFTKHISKNLIGKSCFQHLISLSFITWLECPLTLSIV
jgi:hypothetical protein